MAPSGKHDDYCDSSVLGVHASLSMLPADSTLGNITVKKKGRRAPVGRYGGQGITTSGRRKITSNKRYIRNL